MICEASGEGYSFKPLLRKDASSNSRRRACVSLPHLPRYAARFAVFGGDGSDAHIGLGARCATPRPPTQNGPPPTARRSLALSGRARHCCARAAAPALGVHSVPARGAGGGGGRGAHRPLRLQDQRRRAHRHRRVRDRALPQPHPHRQARAQVHREGVRDFSLTRPISPICQSAFHPYLTCKSVLF